jgi:hypothetical protein
MRPQILVRLGAFSILALLLGQTIGMMTWGNPADGRKKDVVQMMKAISTPFMGSTKSLADYYNGNNWLIFGFHGLAIFILLVLATQIGSSQKRTAIIISSAIALIYFTFSVVYYVYFFPLPVILSLLTSVFLGFAVKKSLEAGSKTR